MIVGIDVGGTNTDAAVVREDGIITTKLPNEVGISGVLSELSRGVNLVKEKVVVSTSLPLNLVISRFNEIKTLTLLVPGPGLNYSEYGVILRGYVNHRGDVVEEIDEEEIRRTLEAGGYDNVAVASKFSIRNSAIEERIREIALNFVEDSKIALSHYAGGMNYPARINTTVINAKIKSTIVELTELVRKYAGDFYYFKGDGGIVPWRVVIENPSELYNSSPAAVAMGAAFLTGEKDALVIDIGGTSTDFVELRNGMPVIVSGITIFGRRTLIRCVDSVSIPFGGDSVVRGRLMPQRLDKPIAFGGRYFTLTDALNCLGHEIGDYRASREAGKNIDSEIIVEQFISQAAEIVEQLGARKVIGAGYLAPILVPEIARRCGVECIIPEHCEAVNAVGVAVSKVSLTLYARFDTEKGIASFNGIIEKCPFRIGSIPSEDEIFAAAVEKLKEMAKSFGAEDAELGEPKLVYFSSFTVVRGGIRRGVIADVIVQLEPGVRYELR